MMIILTLTLSTTTMMLIETSTIESTAKNELAYALGSDIRIDTHGGTDFVEFTRELETYEWIIDATSVISAYSLMGSTPLMLEGIYPREYQNICSVVSDSFNNGDALQMLEALEAQRDGIIISTYWGTVLNRTVGDVVSLKVTRGDEATYESFRIIGFMKSAPGFGYAAEQDMDQTSIPAQLGLQVRPGGFAFVHKNTLRRVANTSIARYFFARTYDDPAIASFCESLAYRLNVEVEGIYYSDIFQEHNDAGVFIRGMYGFTTITTLLCTAMGISSIALFFGAAINERRPEYAIMKALGGTMRQVVSMILGEFAGLIIGVIALSLILGFSFGYLMSILIFAISPFDVLLPSVQTFQLGWILTISLFEASIMLAGCYYTARVAGETNMIQELRNL